MAFFFLLKNEDGGEEKEIFNEFVFVLKKKNFFLDALKTMFTLNWAVKSAIKKAAVTYSLKIC